jgi:hypothetical protein
LANTAKAVTLAQADTGDPADQVYASLWSHAERRPGHIHFVVMPVTATQMAKHEAHGPELQTRMFEAGEPVEHHVAADAANRIRAHLAAMGTIV